MDLTNSVVSPVTTHKNIEVSQRDASNPSQAMTLSALVRREFITETFVNEAKQNPTSAFERLDRNIEDTGFQLPPPRSFVSKLVSAVSQPMNTLKRVGAAIKNPVNWATNWANSVKDHFAVDAVMCQKTDPALRLMAAEALITPLTKRELGKAAVNFALYGIPTIVFDAIFTPLAAWHLAELATGKVAFGLAHFYSLWQWTPGLGGPAGMGRWAGEIARTGNIKRSALYITPAWPIAIFSHVNGFNELAWRYARRFFMESWFVKGPKAIARIPSALLSGFKFRNNESRETQYRTNPIAARGFAPALA